MSFRVYWVVSILSFVACSSPAPMPVAQPAQTTALIDAGPDAMSSAPAVMVAAPKTIDVPRPTWTVGQTLTVTRTFSVRADQREQAGPPSKLSIPLTGLLPLASSAAKDAERAELTRLETILAATTGTHLQNTEVPALAQAISAAFPGLTVTVRSAMFMGSTGGQAAFFLDLQVAGRLSASTQLVEASLVGDLLIDARGLKVAFYAPGKVEIRGGMGGHTTSAVVALELEAR